jgi:uncharacterized coiled-coil protein SlyX
MRTDTSEDVYLDTVSLLQEEIARLEAELQQREDCPREIEPETNRRQEQYAEARILQLTAALAERDESIRLLWDQVTGLQEIEAARTAEWEQLNQWVEELEKRADAQAKSGPPPHVAEQEVEALRDQLESQRRTWEGQRGRFLDEIAELRAHLDETGGAHGDDATATLRQENLVLREQCRRFAQFEEDAAEAATLRDQIHDLRDEFHQLRQALESAQDELEQQRIEHEAEKAALRTKLTSERVAGGSQNGALSTDERVRALRDHLREMHEREEQEQKESQLSHRIARLWRRSTPR